MLRIFDELLWALRRDGFVISTGQAIDVLRVVTLVGLDDRAALRDAIGSVIVDRRVDRARYREAFDAFFAADRSHAGDLWSRLRARGFADSELASLRELLEGAAERSGVTGDALAVLNVLGSDDDLSHLLRAAGIARALAPMTSSLQTGFFAQEVMSRIELPRASTAIRRIGAALRDALGEDRGAALAAALAEELERARRRVRAHVDRVLLEKTAEPEDEQGRRAVEGKGFAALTEAERAEVRASLRALAERLRGAERARRRRAKRGRIDPHRTIRKAMATGGVPFVPVRKKRPRDKPRLIVLCDVSDSVRAASLFMLELVHAAQDLFHATRTFVFVSELAETTRLFDDCEAEDALARVYSGAVVSLAHNSNYGRALASFEEAVSKSVDRRTTILVLGDGRTNYLRDGADRLARLRDRARELVWVCPEAPGTWGTGDSAMPRFAAASSRVLVARSARDLADAARLVASRR